MSDTAASSRPRMEWLDQARGLVVLGLIVSMITGFYSGDPLRGDKPVGPTMYNHGYDYYEAFPNVVTPIDLGQPSFMGLMGFVGFYAFEARRKRGARAAWQYAIRRFLLLYACGLFEECVLNYAMRGKIHWDAALYQGTFAKLAIGAIVAFASIAVIRNADLRFAFAMCVLAVHALLYAFPVADHYTWYDDVIPLFPFPFGVVGHCAIAITGTCTAAWLLRDPDDPAVGMRDRVGPATAAIAVAAYCVDWLQPAEHHDANAALILHAMLWGNLGLIGFYGAGLIGLRFPLLTSFGKNLLLMFILCWFLTNLYLTWFPKEFVLQWPVLGLLLAGVAPILILALIANQLERRNILIRV